MSSHKDKGERWVGERNYIPDPLIHWGFTYKYELGEELSLAVVYRTAMPEKLTRFAPDDF